MKCIFIYNPNSGKGRLIKKLDYIEKCLKTKYDVVDICATVSQTDTIQAARNACKEYDIIVFSGGDGTFNDITCGIASEEKRPLLGYIPSGTVNDIARNLKIPCNYKKALKIILNGGKVFHDVGLINNEKYFMYVTAAGTFTSVSYKTKQKAKKYLGKVAYAIDGITDIFNPAKMDITVKTKEGKTISGLCPLLLVVNSISVGGIPFNKKGHLNDSKFDIVLIKKYMGTGIISIINTLLFGIHRKRSTKYYECVKSSSFDIITTEDVTWTIDGEKGMNGSIHIDNLHNHLEICVPLRNKKPRGKKLWQ